MSKPCIACGMPMVKAQDFAASDMSKDYCRYCCRQDGSMQSYDEKVTSMARFLAESQGLAQPAAEALAKEKLASLPAWRAQG